MNELIENACLYCRAVGGGSIPYQSCLLLGDRASGTTVSVYAFCYRCDDERWWTHPKLRLELKTRLPVGGHSENEITNYWFHHAQAMQLFLYGAVLGWDLTATTPPKDEFDVISLQDHFPVESWGDIHEIRSRLGLDERNIREMTKVDILRLALSAYQSCGAEETHNLVSTQASNALRIQVSNDLLGSCLEDLTREGWLEFDGLEIHPPGLPYRVVPANATAAEDEIERLDARVDHRLMEVAIKNGWNSERQITMAATSEPDGERPTSERVFIIHGHDEAKRRELTELLRTRMNVVPVVMQDQPGRSRTFIEKFEEEADPCFAALAILTPDDVVVEQDGEQRQPRPNVLFELGWFAGRIGRDRVLLIVREGTDVPTDLLGIEQVRFRTDIEEAFVKLEREIAAWKER